MKIKKICRQCGQELKPRIYIYGKYKIINYAKKFCCKKCYDDFKRGKIINPKYEGICQNCGKSFLFDRGHLSRNQKYCSRECNFLDNKDLILKNFLIFRFKKGNKPWNKNLTKETSDLVKQIAEIRKGQIRPDMVEFMKSKKYWQNEKYLFNIFKGQMFGKGYKANKLDKKIINIRMQLFKIKREALSASKDKETAI